MEQSSRARDDARAPAGFLAAFATISFALGLLVLPFAVVAIGLAARVAPGWEALGLLPGIGAMCLLIVVLDVRHERFDADWLAAGLAFVAGGVAAYAATRTLVRLPQPR